MLKADSSTLKSDRDVQRRNEPPITPSVVAFDVIVRSKRHQSGYSLRFPRIVGLRPDKTVDQISTIEEVRKIYEGQLVREEGRSEASLSS